MAFKIKDVPACEHDDARTTVLTTSDIEVAIMGWLTGSLSFPFGETYLQDGAAMLGSISSEWQGPRETTVIRLSRSAREALARKLEELTGTPNGSGIVSTTKESP